MVFFIDRREVHLKLSEYLDSVLTGYSIKSGYTKTHIVRTALIVYFKRLGVYDNEISKKTK